MDHRPVSRRRARSLLVFGSVAATSVLVPAVAHAQLGRATTPDIGEAKPQRGLSLTETSKRYQDATSDLPSVTTPLTGDLGDGESNRTRYGASINPSIPVNLTEDVRMISRAQLPLTRAPVGAGGRETGLGDTHIAVLFGPNRDRTVNYAIGPSMILPTATSSELGSQKWSAGPAVAIAAKQGPWVYGGVTSFNWSLAGAERRRDVSLLTLQPFAYYNFNDGWAVGTSPTATANFAEKASNMFTIPIGGGIYKVIRPDPSVPLSLSVQAYANPIRPDNGPDAQVKFVVAGLFPQ